MSSYINATPEALDVSHQIVSLVDKLLSSNLYESEPTVRALLALGTILLAKSGGKRCRSSPVLDHQSGTSGLATRRHSQGSGKGDLLYPIVRGVQQNASMVLSINLVCVVCAP